ncbi:hypothetical protein BDN70DRAFT_773656, partial [Pholiota conissans]
SDAYKGYRHPFLFGFHYLGGVGGDPRTLVELAMSYLSSHIRRSPDWWNILKNEDAKNEWMLYALNRVINVPTPSIKAEINLSRKQIDYVLKELEGYNALRDGIYQVSCFERIWESSSILDPDITTSLNTAFDGLQPQSLIDPEDDVTWHIIDHRLHCLVYGRTLVSHPNGSTLETVSSPSSSDVYTTSTSFALLPSDVFVREKDSSISVRFLSYINNLHPKHRGTYTLLETLLGGFIPLFEHALTDLHRNNPLVQRIPGNCRYTVWDEPDTPEHSDDEEEWEKYEREMRQWALNRPIDLPDVPSSGYRGGLENRRHIVSLYNRVIQIFVNVSEIKLHPQEPFFMGVPWHVEGMRAERIVACGFHCLSADNITETCLKFRMAVTFPRGFSAGDTGATLRTWGIRDGDPCHQYIGSVPIRPGLSLVYPNIYQQSQTAFKLADPSKEGHFKVIRFFLVDPDVKPVISTSRVAPQQEEWIHQAVDDNLDTRLPYEMIEKIMESIDGLMTFGEAKDYRQKLIEETRRFTQANNSYHFCIPFDIWNGP